MPAPPPPARTARRDRSRSRATTGGRGADTDYSVSQFSYNMEPASPPETPYGGSEVGYATIRGGKTRSLAGGDAVVSSGLPPAAPRRWNSS